MLDAGGVATALILAAFVAPALAWIAWGGPSTGVAPGGIELRMLAWSALASLLLPISQIVLQIRRFGGPSVRGNREHVPAATGVAGRLARAHDNAVQSLAPFAAVVLAAHAAGVSDRGTVAASVVFLAARIVHAVCYAAGLTIVRSSAFYAGWMATAAIGVTVVTRLT